MLQRFSTSRPQFILMIGDDGILCVPSSVAGAPEPFFLRHEDESAHYVLMDLLNRYKHIPVTLFADMLAQDFKTETLPHLSFLDRPKLIQRRLRQAFPQARMTAHLSSKHNRAQIIMAGLHDKSPLFDWLENLKTHTPKTALLPIEAASLVMQLLPDAKSDWAMLISRQRTGGYRQIVTHKGELIFSRLTAPSPETATEDDITTTLQRDIGASLGYLSRLGLNDPTKMRVILLLPDSLHEALEKLNLPVHSTIYLSPRKAAQHLKLPFIPVTTDPYGDLIFAGWLARSPRLRLPLMLPNMKQVKQAKLTKYYGMRLAAASLAFALIITGWQAVGLATSLLAARKANAALAEVTSHLIEEQAAAAPLTEPLGILRQAVERQRLFAQPTTVPWPLLTQLNTSLGDNARLVKLDWQNDDGHPDHEVAQIEIKLTDTAPAERKEVVDKFQSVAKNITSTLPGYNVTVSHYPFPAMPNETVSNEPKEETTIPTSAIVIRRMP